MDLVQGQCKTTMGETNIMVRGLYDPTTHKGWYLFIRPMACKMHVEMTECK